MRHAFRALKSRNYRLYFFGQFFSLMGTWIQNIAMSWLVYRMTGSATLLGLTAFAALVPGFLMGPVTGVVVDAMDKRKLLLLTQSGLAIQALTLAALVFTGVVEVWHILTLSVFLGVVSAFDMPARQAFLVHVVEDRNELGNAIALNSTQFNLARLLGPAIGGFLVTAFGEGTCFLINGISFTALLGALVAMQVGNSAAEKRKGSVWSEVRAGAEYTWRNVPIRSLIGLLAFISLITGAQSVLMPVVAKDVLHGDAATLGFLQAALGVGALVSAIALAARTSVLGIGRWLVAAAVTFGVGMLLVGVATNLAIAMVVFAIVGAGSMTHMAATNTLLQTIVEDHMRGRVMSFYTMAFTGTMPFGSLFAGWLASQIGPVPVFVGSGVLAVVGSLLFMRSLPKLRALIRPIYESKGILAPAGQ